MLKTVDDDDDSQWFYGFISANDDEMLREFPRAGGIDLTPTLPKRISAR